MNVMLDTNCSDRPTRSATRSVDGKEIYHFAVFIFLFFYDIPCDYFLGPKIGPDSKETSEVH